MNIIQRDLRPIAYRAHGGKGTHPDQRILRLSLTDADQLATVLRHLVRQAESRV